MFDPYNTVYWSIPKKKLKTAKVIPIHKTGDKSLMKNYPPISILPVVSKIIENVMQYAYSIDGLLHIEH